MAQGKLQAGDILVSINVGGVEKALNRGYLLGDYMFYFKQGDQVKITVERNGQIVVATIQLDQSPKTIN